MLPRVHLIACPACGCHPKGAEPAGPSGGAPRRRADGSVPRSAAAVLLGLAALATCAAAACGSEVTNVTGAGGAGPGSGSNGGSTADGPQTSVSSTNVSTTTVSVAVSSTYGAGPTPDDCGDLAFPDPACGDCATAVCCSELAQCASGTSCGDLVVCMQSCADQACFDQCEASFPAGVAAFDALQSCISASCSAECATPDTLICDTDLTTGEAACDACLGTSCCADFQFCVQDGADVQACIDCFDAGGGPLCDDALACAAASCANECSFLMP